MMCLIYDVDDGIISKSLAKLANFAAKHHCAHHYIFIISQLWLTSHPRSTVVLLDTRTPGTSKKIYSVDADGETRTCNPSVINGVL